MKRTCKHVRPHPFAGPLLLLLFPFLPAACRAPDYTLLVNTYAEPGKVEAGPPLFPAGTAFFVQEARDAVNPLLEVEAVRKAKELLAEKGFRATSLEEAGFVVRLRYGSGPVFLRAEVTSEPGPGPGFSAYGGFGCAWPGGGYGWYGWERPVLYVEHRFLHGLLVYVYDGPAFRRGEEKALWVGECTARSRSPDLRAALPVMLEALFARLGTDTKKGVIEKVTVKETDP